MAKRWTLDDDISLVTWVGMGPDYVASHDLGFLRPKAGTKRLKLLEEEGMVAKIEAFIDARDTMTFWHTMAFSRSKEARSIAYKECINRGLPIPDWANFAWAS